MLKNWLLITILVLFAGAAKAAEPLASGSMDSQPLSLAISETGPKEVIIACSDYVPFVGQSLEGGGPVAEITQRAFELGGYQVKLVYVPWLRALNTAKQGGYDGLLVSWYRKEREEFFVYSPSLVTSVMGFYKRKADQIDVSSLDDLQPYKIGLVRGYSNPEAFVSANLRSELTTTNLQNLYKLSSGRVDLVLIEKSLAAYLVSTEMDGADNIEWVEPSFVTESLHLLISREAADYKAKAEAFERGFEQLKASGELSRIVKKI